MTISRTDAEVLIQEQISQTIFQDTPKQSVFMQLAKKLPNMTSKQTRVPVLDLLPLAYFVNGDTGYKNYTQQAWDKVYMTAEEIAVIVPISEAVLEDANYDIMGEVAPRVNEAFGLKVDGAVFFGVERPAGWEADIVTRARQAGNNVAITGSPVDYYDLLLGENGALAKVENGAGLYQVLLQLPQ
jgi:HK97 family phage major capsid protein